MATRTVFRQAVGPVCILRGSYQRSTTFLYRKNASSLAGESRSVIVTGAARGIGKAIAIRLAQDGYNVCVNDLQSNRSGIEETVSEVKSMGCKAVGVEADVTDYSQVVDMVQKSVKELGPLKTMVANAGIVQVKMLLDLTPEDFDTMFRVNVLGVQNSYKAAALQFREQGNATQDSPCKLIAAASIASIKPFGMLAHYCASKAAVVALTHNYAIELAEQNITCNCYSPGIVGTAMWELIDREVGKIRGEKLGVAVKKGEILKKSSNEMISLGRTSVPEDVAKLLSFLASKDSDYITGQNMIVDGGIVFR